MKLSEEELYRTPVDDVLKWDRAKQDSWRSQRAENRKKSIEEFPKRADYARERARKSMKEHEQPHWKEK